MQKVVLIAIAVVALGGTVWMQWDKTYIPHTDEITFERDLNASTDEGRQLNAGDLVSKEGVRLTDIFSLERSTFTLEGINRYGGELNSPGGGGQGLTIHFIQHGGEKIESFTLPGWKRFEETSRPVRRQQVTNAEMQLAEAIKKFVAPVGIKRAFGVALDKTEGVKPDFAKRVREVINKTGAVALGSDKKNTVALNLYNITEDPYQGGREQPKLDSPDAVKASIEWMTKEDAARKNSSVLRGLVPILKEMASYTDSRPVLHIFTDGLENTEDFSVLKKGNEKFLEEANWSTMDEVANLGALKLAGLTVHLHPLPESSPRHAAMMEKGLAYLAARLKTAGANVVLETQ